MVANFAEHRRITLWRRLWIALAEAERELGLPIRPEQIAAMRAKIDEVDFARVAELEARVRHDVMAHVHHFGELVGSGAEKVIHLGATSCYVTDNAELVMIRDGLELVMDRIVAALEALRAFAAAHRELATLAYTHFQPAQLTTVGKRACLWAQDFALDLESVAALRQRLPFRGVKGTTGTQASFLALFDGNHAKVRELDRKVAEAMGFAGSIPISGQTYSRKIDSWVVSTLADVSASAAKMASDLRLLAHERELEEPFGADQVGSSAMAYKRNPMRSERICSLARFVASLATSPPATHANQWRERTLDDSANRRLVITEAFLATDAILNLVVDVSRGLVVNPAVIRANMADELPFMATENVIMAGVRGGHSRQELHERVRKHSHEAARRMKEEGVANDLLARMRADDLLGPFVPAEPINPRGYVGRAPEQVDEFLAEVLDPLLVEHAHRRGRFTPAVSV
jgi:adenylosuccinate lyase